MLPVGFYCNPQYALYLVTFSTLEFVHKIP